MADVFPPDYTSDVGRVRKYIPDVILRDDPRDPLLAPSYLWADEDIQSFIDDVTDMGLVQTSLFHIYRAAANVMIATANNEALILKKIVTEDLQTDGPGVANALLKGAAALHGRADALEDEAAQEEIFLTVDYYHTPPRTDWR